MKQMPTRRRPGLRTVAILLSLLLLTGCAQAQAGQTAKAANSMHLAGAEVNVLSSSSYNGFAKVISHSVRIQVDPGYEIADPTAVVEYLAKVGWSVNDARPTTGTTLSFAKPISFDPVEAARKGGWHTTSGTQNSRSSLIYLNLKEVKHRLGTWPGKIPHLPDGAIVKVSDNEPH